MEASAALSSNWKYGRLDGAQQDQHKTLTRASQFVQALSNPWYLNYLASQKYLHDPTFINYLDYLQYFSQPKYLKYLSYVIS